MADAKETKTKKDGETASAAAGEKRRPMGIRMTPVNNSDQPVFANVCSVNVAPGMAFIDFGFLEPAMLAALPRVAKQGGKLPERIDGKLAVRVALGYDALAGLHQQITQVLRSLSQAATGTKKES